MLQLKHEFVQVGSWFAGLLLGAGLMAAAAAEPAPGFSKPADLFQLANVWSVHLRFTSDQWEAMEPKGGPGGFFGGPMGAGGPRGSGGAGRLGGPGGPVVFPAPGGPVNPGEFGPGMFLAPVFLKQGDDNQDGKLTRLEFQSLAGKWFGGWDKDKSGLLKDDQLRAGLNEVFAPPAFAQPGMGGPGGRGGRPPGLNLQGPEGKRNGLASAMGIEFEYVHATLEFAGQTFSNVAVRYKGNGTFLQSRGTLKRSLKVDLGKFVKGQKLAGMSQFNFHNCVTDASWMNEVLSHRLFREAGVPAPRTAYARVFVTVPGQYDRQYLGLYSLVEDVGKDFIEDCFGTKKGALFKPVTPDLFAVLGDDWKSYNQIYDPKEQVANEEKRRVMEFCRFVTQAEDAAFAARLGEYLNLDEFARFMAVTVWLCTLDSILGPGQNFYLYLDPKTQRFLFIPWDLDHSFGQFPLIGTQEQRENLSIRKPWQGERRFLERVFGVEAFQKLYLAALAEFNRTIFQPERFHQQVDEITAAIRPAVQEESTEKLARFDQVVAGESLQPPGFGGGPIGFMPAIKPIKPFVKLRAQSVNAQVTGTSPGQRLSEFGFGGPNGGGGPGGPGGPGGRGGGPGGPGGFGPGLFLAGAFKEALDANRDGALTRDEFTQGFAKWFAAWNTDRSGALTEEQVRAGINRDLSPFRGGPPGGAGFGFPGGPPPREP